MPISEEQLFRLRMAALHRDYLPDFVRIHKTDLQDLLESYYALGQILTEVLYACDAALPHTDSRMHYVEAQIDRSDIDEIRAALEKLNAK